MVVSTLPLFLSENLLGILTAIHLCVAHSDNFITQCLQIPCPFQIHFPLLDVLMIATVYLQNHLTAWEKEISDVTFRSDHKDLLEDKFQPLPLQPLFRLTFSLCRIGSVLISQLHNRPFLSSYLVLEINTPLSLRNHNHLGCLFIFVFHNTKIQRKIGKAKNKAHFLRWRRRKKGGLGGSGIIQRRIKRLSLLEDIQKSVALPDGRKGWSVSGTLSLGVSHKWQGGSPPFELPKKNLFTVPVTRLWSGTEKPYDIIEKNLFIQVFL